MDFAKISIEEAFKTLKACHHSAQPSQHERRSFSRILLIASLKCQAPSGVKLAMSVELPSTQHPYALLCSLRVLGCMGCAHIGTLGCSSRT